MEMQSTAYLSGGVTLKCILQLCLVNLSGKLSGICELL